MATSTTTIAGRYRLDSRLGVGGMSTVYLAFDQRLERSVAIKLLAEHLADDPAFVSRFRREALAAARLVHPNIVQVFDFGFDEAQHQHFIVMEHVAGRSCAELLRDRGRLEVPEAVEIIGQACNGLDYAHRNGVIHRDVKPGNLLVSDVEAVKLADFGIARATDLSSITQVGSVLGTAAYLAPEQARGEEAGPRADLYSLGVVAYQLLSGRLPYEATSLTELALKQQGEVPTPLEVLNPEIPRALSRAVAVALALDKTQRPADAAAFAEVLRRGAQGIDPFTAVTQHQPGSADAPTAQFPASATTRIPRPPGGFAPRPAVSYRADTAATQLSDRRPAPRWEPPPQPRPWQPPPRRKGSLWRAIWRTILLLALMVAVAAAVITAVELSAGGSTAVHFRHVVAHDAQQAITAVEKLIGVYSK
ncbi:MAG: serine/threonine protein kinase [Solirubrobacterales bacterium]|nr:serine/threonine protein kinase [Solirubrobacterales bacterium]